MAISDKDRSGYEAGVAEREWIAANTLSWVLSGGVHPRPSDPDAAAAYDKGFRNERLDEDKQG